MPIDKFKDLKAVKIRAREGPGASSVNLPSSEVHTSLDKHVIDASEYSTFAAIQAASLNKIAPNPIYPGFRSMPLINAVGGAGPESFLQWLAAGADGFGIGTALYRSGAEPRRDRTAGAGDHGGAQRLRP